jgi:hypothetical protein
MLPSSEEESGALLSVDLDEALDQYVRESRSGQTAEKTIGGGLAANGRE